jgi:phage baseplate assembly protein W
MANNTRTFVDLDLNFTPHPVTGDIVVRLDENAIKRSVRNLILTKNYERPFHSEIGSQATALMFENADAFTETIIRQTIIDTIITFEPRVELIDVGVVFRPDNNAADVRIDFRILNTFTPVTMELVLERTR